MYICTIITYARCMRTKVTSPPSHPSSGFFSPPPVASLRTHPNRAVVEVVRYESPAGWQFSQQIMEMLHPKTPKTMHPNGSSCLFFLGWSNLTGFFSGTNHYLHSFKNMATCRNYPIFKRRLIFIQAFSGSLKNITKLPPASVYWQLFLSQKNRPAFCANSKIWPIHVKTPIFFGWDKGAIAVDAGHFWEDFLILNPPVNRSIFLGEPTEIWCLNPQFSAVFAVHETTKRLARYLGWKRKQVLVPWKIQVCW